LFPNSDIAKKYSSGLTKTTAIVNAMSKDPRHCMVADLQRKAYPVCTDGGNDADMKLYPIVNEEL
jgi:hypothetical protein